MKGAVGRAAVELRRVSFSYSNGRGVRDVHLEALAGEICALTGPSGSGKSTILAVAGLILVPDVGDVLIGGHAVTRSSEAERDKLRRDRLRFVWQDSTLISYLNAWENVAVQGGRDLLQHQEAAMRALERLGVKHVAESHPHSLSGGERQRVALARCFIGDPWLVLADEPTGNLDAQATTTVLDQLRILTEERGAAVVVATHDPAVVNASDREGSVGALHSRESHAE